jgi:hypothetical protein
MSERSGAAAARGIRKSVSLMVVLPLAVLGVVVGLLFRTVTAVAVLLLLMVLVVVFLVVRLFLERRMD